MTDARSAPARASLPARSSCSSGANLQRSHPEPLPRGDHLGGLWPSAVLFHGMHVRLSARIGPGPAALVTTLVVGIAIVAPAVVLISALVREVPQVTESVARMSQSAPLANSADSDALRTRIPVPMPEDRRTPRERKGTCGALAFLAPRAGAFVADVLGTLGSLAAILFALFLFMLRDGEAMARHAGPAPTVGRRERAPHERDARPGDGQLRRRAHGGGRPGSHRGVVFWLVGIGVPVFWDIIIGFCSLLPVVGPPSCGCRRAWDCCWQERFGRGALLMLLGVLGISMADNVLRPLLLSGRTSISGLSSSSACSAVWRHSDSSAWWSGRSSLSPQRASFEHLRHPDVTGHV